MCGARCGLLFLAIAGGAGAVAAAAFAASIWRHASTARAEAVVVQVGATRDPRDRYVPARLTIQQGDTVDWELADGRHDVVEFAGAFASPMMIGSGTTSFTRTFDAPGLVGYYCSIHATPSDLDTNGDGAFTETDSPDTWNRMVAWINVQGPRTNTPTETSAIDPSTTPPPTDTPTVTRTATASATVSATPTSSPTPGPNTVVIDMGNYFFGPKNVTVRPGDIVRWVNVSDLPHTSTSPAGWDSGIVPAGGTYERKFDEEGSFAYLCELHMDLGQTGVIGVRSDVTSTPTAGTPTTAASASPTAVTEVLATAQAPPASTAPPSRAPTTVDVSMTEYAFEPSWMVVYAGDTVRWTNAGTVPHNATADDGSWASTTLMDPGEQYSRRFDTPGVFAYRCALHSRQGQRGTVEVRASTVLGLPSTGAGSNHANGGAYVRTATLLGGAAAILGVAAVAIRSTRGPTHQRARRSSRK
jgi:plastocyanin